MLNWFDPALNTVLSTMLILFAIALFISSIGFYRVVYFISIGYAFSIVAMALYTPLAHMENLTWALVLQNGLFIFWGLRLGIYLVRREYQASYRKEAANVHERSAGMSRMVQFAIWVGVSLLYVLMFSPSLFGLMTPNSPTASKGFFQIAGLVMMVGGLILEGIADKQKSEFKAHHPAQYCDIGLYRWVRCPNYLGEITFWVGNWVAGIAFFDTPFKWIAALIGVVCIVLIMIGSTKRLEKSQEERYGQQPEFQQYIRTVPVLLPFVPVYSLKKVRVFLE